MLKKIKDSKFYRPYTTKQHKQVWLNWLGRTTEQYWQEYISTWNHPHRFVISNALRSINWTSLMEVGCGSGPNLANILQHHKGKQVGGVDINPKAIEVAGKTFRGGMFKVGSAEDILISDKGTDVILSDMTYVYVGPFKIRKYLKEARRVAREYVILCEFHETNWFRRQKLRLNSGMHAYDYKKLLESLDFYNVSLYKMPKFEEDNDYSFRWLIIARVPK